MTPPSVTAIAIVSLSLHVATLGIVGWSASVAVRYVASVQMSAIRNGRRIAAYAIAWRCLALGMATTGTAIGAGLILLTSRTLDLASDLWRAGSLLLVSVALALMAIADVYERIAIDRHRTD